MEQKYEAIGKRIAEALSIRGMSQQELSEKTNLPKSAISQYIHGKNDPKQKNIYKMAVALAVRPDWLMGLEVPMETTEQVDMTKAERAMLMLFRSLDTVDKEKIIERIETFLESDKYKKGSEAVG